MGREDWGPSTSPLKAGQQLAQDSRQQKGDAPQPASPGKPWPLHPQCGRGRGVRMSPSPVSCRLTSVMAAGGCLCRAGWWLLVLPAAQGPHLPGHIAAGWRERGDPSARCSHVKHKKLSPECPEKDVVVSWGSSQSRIGRGLCWTGGSSWPKVTEETEGTGFKGLKGNYCFWHPGCVSNHSSASLSPPISQGHKICTGFTMQKSL